MSKRKESKLDNYADQLEQWLGAEQMTLSQAQEQLAKMGCVVSLGRLSEWRRGRAWERTRAQLLEQIAEGARHCEEVEKEFGKNPPPELETLIKLHRLTILQLSAQKNADRETISLVTALMRPVMEWARLEEKRRERELAEQKYRDQVEAQEAAAEREKRAANEEGGLSPETLEKIERELRLM